MRYLFSLLPILLYILLLYSGDAFRLCRRRWLYYSGLFGLLVSPIVILLLRLIPLDNMLIVPLVEELLKGSFVVWLVARRRISFPLEGLIYGACVGAGFALVENTLYVVNFHNLTIMESLIRGTTTALLHIGNTAIVGTLSIIIVRELYHQRHITPYPFLVLALIPSILFHVLYNQMLIPITLQIPLSLLLYLLIILLLFRYDRYLVERWLDVMVDSEINLLTTIRRGELHLTPVGDYLKSLHTQFSPEEIADIIACFTLHLQLSVAAKSRLMLQESGLDRVLTPEQHQSNQAMLSEYYAVCSRIGKRGILAISPIITIHSFDRQAFRIMMKK